MHTTRTSREVRATPVEVYAALIDPDAVARWRVPDGMTSRVHEWEPREGGRFRVSLTYDAGGVGKSAAQTDTYHGRFVRLVPHSLVVERSEFETDDPALQGEMTLTTSIIPTANGVRVEILHEGLPDAVPPADNETGTRIALDRLAQLLERSD